MKITLAELRKMIRDVLTEEATLRWGGDGSVSPDAWEAVYGTGMTDDSEFPDDEDDVNDPYP